MLTLAQVLNAIEGRIINPGEGTAGQHLVTDGAGGAAWNGSASQVIGERLKIGGAEYIIRTGSAGADGYLTISDSRLFLGETPVTLDIGGKAVKEIWLGAQRIYTASRELVIFDKGYVHDIGWAVNKFPRQGNGSYGRGSLDKVSDGYMELYISDGSSTLTHNSHVTTQNPVEIPVNAKNISVSVRKNGANLNMKFGLISPNAAYADAESRGALLSTSIAVKTDTYTTYTLALTDTVKGAQMHPVINAYGQANAPTRELWIDKVWFD